MNNFFILSHNYAKSLFIISKNLEMDKDVLISLEYIQKQHFVNSKSLNITLGENFKLNVCYIFCDFFNNIGIYHPLVHNMIKAIVKNNFFFLLNAIINIYLLYQNKFNKLQLIKIVIPLKCYQIFFYIKRIIRYYLYKKKIIFDVEINPNILSGFKVVTEYFLLDCSLKSKIAKIKKKLFYYV